MRRALHAREACAQYILKGGVVLDDTCDVMSGHAGGDRQDNSPADATTLSTRPNVDVTVANAFWTERSDETSHSTPMIFTSSGFRSLFTFKVFSHWSMPT